MQPVAAGAVRDAVRRAIAAEHGAKAHDVVLVPLHTLPFTSSAKLQRSECRGRYQAGTLETVGA